jgi:hypothetical protein
MRKIVTAILLCMAVGAAQPTNVERTSRQLIN